MEDEIKPTQQPESEQKPVDNRKMRRCSKCGQLHEIKSPWEELWRMPTLQEWLILFMMAMMIFAAWAYQHDVKQCKDYINNIDLICSQRKAVVITNYSAPPLNGVIINNSSNKTTWGSNSTTPLPNNTIYVASPSNGSSNDSVPDLNVSNLNQSNETT